jgi:hypothetical protein
MRDHEGVYRGQVSHFASSPLTSTIAIPIKDGEGVVLHNGGTCSGTILSTFSIRVPSISRRYVLFRSV